MARAVVSGAAALSPATRSPRAVVAAPRPPRRASVVAPRAHAVRAPPLEPARRDRVVVRAGDSEPESLFQKEKAFIPRKKTTCRHRPRRSTPVGLSAPNASVDFGRVDAAAVSQVGKLLFFLLPFALGVVDWINPELLHWF